MFIQYFVFAFGLFEIINSFKKSKEVKTGNSTVMGVNPKDQAAPTGRK